MRVRQVGAVREALAALREDAFDLIIVDLALKGEDGINLIQQIQSKNPDLPILVLSMHEETRLIVQALEAGALGYVTKASSPEELLRGVEALCEGRAYLDSHVAHAVVGRLQEVSGARARPTGSLTRREQEILEMAVSGLSNSEIATRISVSLSTVKLNFRAIFRKLDVSDRTQAILEALRKGLIRAPGLQVTGDDDGSG